METSLGQILESHRAPEVTVAWQGGEPTSMGIDFFKPSVACAERCKRPGRGRRPEERFREVISWKQRGT